MQIVNTHHIGVPSTIAGASLLVVLIDASHAPAAYHDYRAYEGIVLLPPYTEANANRYAEERASAAEWVKVHGRKLQTAEAKVHFPSMSGEIS